MKNEIYKMLEEVEEPLLGIDIVNLGLVYEVCVKDEHDVEIVMTTRSEDCPLADYLALSTQELLQQRIKGLDHIDVKMVSSPRWTQDRMTRYAKYLLELQ